VRYTPGFVGAVNAIPCRLRICDERTRTRGSLLEVADFGAYLRQDLGPQEFVDLPRAKVEPILAEFRPWIEALSR
jgi:hypothetical protein